MLERRYFILVGDELAWRTALKMRLWGFPERSVGNWNTSNLGDYVAFYVTNPFKKIIGYGKITNKFKSDDIIWPDENLFHRSIWKYKVKFKKLRLVDDWNRGIPVPQDIMLNTGRKVVTKELFFHLVNRLC